MSRKHINYEGKRKISNNIMACSFCFAFIRFSSFLHFHPPHRIDCQCSAIATVKTKISLLFVKRVKCILLYRYNAYLSNLKEKKTNICAEFILTEMNAYLTIYCCKYLISEQNKNAFLMEIFNQFYHFQ